MHIDATLCNKKNTVISSIFMAFAVYCEFVRCRATLHN